MCQRIGNGDLLPRAHWYGTEWECNILVMDLLGCSIAGLHNQCGGKFSLATAMLVTMQMLQCVEYIHNHGYIHRDIKPDNFAIGRNEPATRVRIIDLGLARSFRDPHTQKHLPEREGAGFAGTARYASARAHNFEDQSRRDDIESIGYVSVYLSTGIRNR